MGMALPFAVAHGCRHVPSSDGELNNDTKQSEREIEPSIHWHVDRDWTVGPQPRPSSSAIKHGDGDPQQSTTLDATKGGACQLHEIKATNEGDGA